MEIDPSCAQHRHVDPIPRAMLSHASLTEISQEIDPSRAPHCHVDSTRHVTLSHASLTRISTEIGPNCSAPSCRSHTSSVLRCPRSVARATPDSWSVRFVSGKGP
eukprot:2007041-Rhodomonas_salina.1